MSATARQLAAYLERLGIDSRVVGNEDIEALRPVAYSQREPGGFSWLRPGLPLVMNWQGVLVANQVPPVPPTDGAVIVTKNPRLAFAYLAGAFFWEEATEAKVRIHPTAFVHESSVVGVMGQGFVWDPEQERYVAMPHFRGVEIGRYAFVGPQCTIARGVLTDTVIGEGSKIGNGVNIGHGCRVGLDCLISAHATLGGSVELGNRVKVWQGATVANGVNIGDGAIVGMGAVVLRDVPEGEVWVGNPAGPR